MFRYWLLKTVETLQFNENRERKAQKIDLRVEGALPDLLVGLLQQSLLYPLAFLAVQLEEMVLKLLVLGQVHSLSLVIIPIANFMRKPRSSAKWRLFQA